jgi:hypothetical protein
MKKFKIILVSMGGINGDILRNPFSSMMSTFNVEVDPGTIGPGLPCTMAETTKCDKYPFYDCEDSASPDGSAYTC